VGLKVVCGRKRHQWDEVIVEVTVIGINDPDNGPGYAQSNIGHSQKNDQLKDRIIPVTRNVGQWRFPGIGIHCIKLNGLNGMFAMRNVKKHQCIK
jgi:hypothetical protein